MTDNFNIERPLTSDEQKDIIPAGEMKSRSALNQFLAKLANKAAEYQKVKYQPFDHYGAKLDFENYVKIHVGEEAISASAQKLRRLNKSFDIDFDKYGDANRFNYVGKEIVRSGQVSVKAQSVVVKEVNVVTGMRYKYITKERGNRVTIFVPEEKVDEIDKWVQENFQTQDNKSTKKETKIKDISLGDKTIVVKK